MIKKIYTFFERQAFGVCKWWGEKLNIPASRIRLFFIYTSFLSLGSPLIIYFGMVFFFNIRNYIKKRRSSVWDL